MCTNVSVKLKLQQHQWQKEGRNAFSCRTKSLQIQQIIRIQYNKNWETLLAYLLRTKLLCNATEITATRSLNAQLFFVCHATYKAFYKKIHLLRLLPVHSIPRAYMRYSDHFTDIHHHSHEIEATVQIPHPLHMGIKFSTPWKTLIIKFPPPGMGVGGCWSFDLTDT